MMETVIVETDGPVGIVMLNRPEKRNALNSELANGIAEAIAAFEADEQIRAIVIGGSSDRAFCAGADMSEAIGRMDSGAGGARSQAIGRLFQTLAAARKPLIGAIEGYCYGGGAQLATLLDIRLCSDNATFRFPGAEYGLVVAGSSLPRIVGPAMAKELIFTADIIDAAEAGRIGFVNHVYVGEVWPAAIALAHRIAANSPAAVQSSKQVIDQATDNATAIELENQLNRDLRSSQEHQDRFRSATHRVTSKSTTGRAG